MSVRFVFFILHLCLLGANLDHYWHWEGGQGVDGPTHPDGAFLHGLLPDCCRGVTPAHRLTWNYFGQNDAFAETSGILSGTFRRMNNMAERQGCRWLWYIVFMIVVFWFFMVVWWFRR